MVRDTVYVRPQSYIVMRFKADNPGVWFFHCHIEWHLEQGLAFQLIEDPQGIQKNEKITDNHKQICEKVGVPWEGNAAANSKDYLNLVGENVQVKRLPTGFTAKGIVALVSHVSQHFGIAAISYYGMNDIENMEKRVARDLMCTLMMMMMRRRKNKALLSRLQLVPLLALQTNKLRNWLIFIW